MGVMAVNTFYMSAADNYRFYGVMHIRCVTDRVAGKLIKLGLYIVLSDIAIMTAQAVAFFYGIIQYALLTAGIMGCVAVFTGIAGNSGGIGSGPGVGADTIPCCTGCAMGCLAPEIFNMANLAEGGCGIGHHQKFPIGIVMWVMAAGALKLTAFIQFDRACQAGGVNQLTSL